MFAIDESIMRYLALQELFKDYGWDALERDPILTEIKKQITDLVQRDPGVVSRVKTLGRRRLSVKFETDYKNSLADERQKE